MLVSSIFGCSINDANPDAICFDVLDYGAAGDGTTDDSQVLSFFSFPVNFTFNKVCVSHFLSIFSYHLYML